VIDSERQDPHDVLEVKPGCSEDELRAAYERAKRQLGPDSLATYALVDPSEARAMLERIELAYRALGRPSEPGGGVADEQVQAQHTGGGPAVTDEPKENAVEAAKPEAPPETPAVEAKAEKSEAPAAPAAVSEPKPPAPEAVEPTKPVRKAEAELAPDGPVTGEALRRVREAHGLSLKDLEAKTKIGHWHLENIEKERYKDLPALVYLRGFLQSLARELKLDPIRVSRSYLEEMTKAKEEPKKQG
jgi:curved DNA-binding protein CbpA